MIRTLLLTASLVVSTFGATVYDDQKYNKELGKWYTPLPGPFMISADDFY